MVNMTIRPLVSWPCLLFLLLQYNLIYAHWICDLAEVPCDASRSSEMCPVQNMDAWHDITSAEVVTSARILFCASKCLQKGCLCALFDSDQSQCFLAYGEIRSASFSGVLAVIGENVALEKPPFSSGVYKNVDLLDTTTRHAWYAIDGIVAGDNFYQSDPEGTTTPWFLVNLEEPFQIRAIKLICRSDLYRDDRFRQVAVMFGNTLTTYGDFSTYTVAAVVPGPNPGPHYWFFLRPTIIGKYQYVALQRQATFGTPSLEIGELEIYA